MQLTSNLKPVHQFTFYGVKQLAGRPVAMFADQQGEQRPFDLDSLRSRRKNLAEQGLRCEASDLAIGLLERATAEHEASARPAEEAP